MNLTELDILVVDDEEDYCNTMEMILSAKGHNVETCNDGMRALEHLKDTCFDLVITDLSMPNMDGLTLLEKIKEKEISTEVIMLTAYGTIEKAVKTMKLGAYSYVTKGADPEEMLHEISKLQEIKTIQRENTILKEKVGKTNYMLESKNQEYKQMLSLAKRAAQSDSNILILGESGSGKEVLANYIHNESKRSKSSLMELNCQALSESILESELFGHEKGAFTGATSKHIGLFEEANKGTLFLDEIGGVSVNLQGKLLKAIENKRIYRVGSTKTIDTDFRLITATNRNLQEDMKDNTFRSDLFYRISTIVLELPPLRERPEDIELFVEHFFSVYAREMKKKITEIEPKVKCFLREYHYPGNIRELKNIIERMVVLSERGEIKEEYLPAEAFKGSKETEYVFPIEEEKTLKEYRSQAEKAYIESLIKAHCNMDYVAGVLGITRRQLFNKMMEYKLK